MLQKQAQDLKFLVGQFHAGAVCRDGVLVGIDAYTAAFQNIGGPVRLAAAKHCLDAGDELHHPEGLDKIVVRAEIEPLNFVILCALGCGHDDADGGKAGIGFHAPQKLYTVYARQHDVQNDELGGIFLQRVPEFLPILEALCLEAGRLQGVDLNVTDAGVVFHAPDHVAPSLLCTPVTEKSTHWAMFTAWSAIRSKYFAIIKQSRKYAPSAGSSAIFLIRFCLTSSK